MQVITEKKDGITTITLNRPEVRNAIDGPTAEELASALRGFDDDRDSLVAVLYGAGGHFCAGADLKAIHAGAGINRLEPTGDAPLGPSRMFLTKPLIAAVSGYAVAGGLELALLCDLRVVERSAVFGVFCRRWGVPLIDGGTVRLPRLIGLSRALDMILTGRPVYSDEALAFGLANRVVDDGTSLEKAQELAKELGRFPQTCMRSDRCSAYEQGSLDLPQALINEFRHGMGVIESGETLWGAALFSGGRGRHGSFTQ
ncbi:MAG TPA: crotonase/enoyl-CoA hydratase family protein [Deltaproteobacteria bacterium]|mgnify:CR=1 FL=1|nr:crotonase/enoyl-CoA hydratase family protein [Deltaproteobacteria bacterium]